MTADRFNRDLMLAAAGHALVLAFVFLQAVFLPSDPIDLRQAIRVDVVGLPEKMTELPAPAPPDAKDSAPPAPEPVKELPAKPVEPPPEPKAPQVQLEKPKVKPPKDLSKAQKAAMDKLKRRSAIDKIKDEMAEAAAKKKSATAGKAAGQVVKGNEISKGDSLTGISKIQFDEYLSSMKSKVLSNWSVPQWLMEANLKASVVVLVNESGGVMKKTILRSSGNDIFDGQAMEAVDKSSPFQPPPDRIRGVLSTSGIIFNFPQ